MNPRIKIALRLLGFALLFFAAVRFVIDAVSSFHSSGPTTRTDGGYQIDQFIEISNWALFAGLLGIVAVSLSAVRRRSKVQDGPI